LVHSVAKRSDNCLISRALRLPNTFKYRGAI